MLELYKNRQNVDKEAYLASYDEIKENDFNLNIPTFYKNILEEGIRYAGV